ncbi:hypothetical protein Bbelb_172330 [Branchiostoma belcheri]|nr:hypothetical protein Bbelb_172330 [Branchiostoma belcheri]
MTRNIPLCTVIRQTIYLRSPQEKSPKKGSKTTRRHMPELQQDVKISRIGLDTETDITPYENAQGVTEHWADKTSLQASGSIATLITLVEAYLLQLLVDTCFGPAEQTVPRQGDFIIKSWKAGGTIVVPRSVALSLTLGTGPDLGTRGALLGSDHLTVGFEIV